MTRPNHPVYTGTRGLLRVTVVGDAPTVNELIAKNTIITVEDGTGAQYDLMLWRFERFEAQDGVAILDGVMFKVVNPENPQGPPRDVVGAWGLYQGAGSDLRLNLD